MFNLTKVLVLIIAFSVFFDAFSQDTVYARKIINQLASNQFEGRGYVNKADKKAANYIVNEYKKIGLIPLKNKSFIQKFSFPVNIFPKTVEVSINNKLLRPGIDYIINPDCPSYVFEGNVDLVDIIELNNESHFDTKGYLLKKVVLDTFSPKYYQDAAINLKKYLKDYSKELIVQLSNEKLTWGSSYFTGKKCFITIKKSAVEGITNFNLKIKIKNKMIQKYTSQNVIGMIKGYSNKDTFIMLTAHYDHLGVMGKEAIFNGANDNASGIAMMLDIAKHYAKNKPKYNLVFVAFSGEELGLIGSKYYVEHPFFPLSKIKFLINIDLMGNGAEGVMAVNGSVFGKEFNLLKSINDENKYLPQVKSRGKAANSDHYWFSEQGVKCFFFYLMGPYPYYHDVYDRPEMVPLTNYTGAFLLFNKFIDAL
ncbi:MAG: M28 family peptidase [Bacteroidota bacterium]|nr:M28 family peptidase [Bacteroidota bacterium]